MKVAVITRHAVSNYGSLLQAFATQKIIENMGHTCEIIDYIRNDERYDQYELSLLKMKPRWNNNLIKKIIYLATRQPECILVGKRFEAARQEILHLTKKYSFGDQLLLDKPRADVYLTGSDQVWGHVINNTLDSNYCLSFTGENDKRIAYAASFGKSEFTSESKEFFHIWLSRYKYIAVREDSAVSLLNEIGVQCSQVLDPTLLIGQTDWEQYIVTKPKKKYVLVYQLHNDNKLGNYASMVARKMGLPLVRISASLHQIMRQGKFVWLPQIEEFLSYIKYAECMITDSFHGTAFAITFNTPFVDVLPNNGTNSRNMSILKLTGLTNRILTSSNGIKLAEEKIDFSSVNEVMEKERIRSADILKQMIET